MLEGGGGMREGGKGFKNPVLLATILFGMLGRGFRCMNLTARITHTCIIFCPNWKIAMDCM